VPLAFLGLPSLHSIIEAIANGFFGALANALVPGFLKHGTVATIQHLVALPDPDTWSHVHQLQGDMTYLAAMLMPVTLAVGTLRYWLIGFTGQAHPVAAVARCSWVTAVLVAYGWIVGQSVAATNTLTHAILGFPTVGDGLQRIIGVLFGGALLTGAGGVFGAFLVIIGVLFAAGLFAAQVLLTVVLALLIVAGPPLIALSAIPELSHLARGWAHALLATALVPIGWTILFATAGALSLDATSFTGGAQGLPGHIAAAFAGLITFVLAVKLPLMLFGELRRLFAAGSLSGHSGRATVPSGTPGVERVRAAHARLRSAALEGVPSLGRSVGRAAGAMGAPAGGPVGAARRGLAGAATRAGILPATAAAGVSLAGATASRGAKPRRERPGVRERLSRAGAIVRDAPSDARAAMAAGANKNTAHVLAGATVRSASTRSKGGSAGNSSARKPAAPAPAGSRSAGAAQTRSHEAPGRTESARQQQGQANVPSPPSARATRQPAPHPPAQPAPRPQPPGPAASRAAQPTEAAAGAPDGSHPGRKVTAAASRETAGPAPEASKRPGEQRPTGDDSPKPSRPPQPPERRAPASRKPRPGREP
jgi:hypothetical protein